MSISSQLPRMAAGFLADVLKGATADRVRHLAKVPAYDLPQSLYVARQTRVFVTFLERTAARSMGAPVGRRLRKIEPKCHGTCKRSASRVSGPAGIRIAVFRKLTSGTVPLEAPRTVPVQGGSEMQVPKSYRQKEL